jgi:hypothetical protein
MFIPFADRNDASFRETSLDQSYTDYKMIFPTPNAVILSAHHRNSNEKHAIKCINRSPEANEEPQAMARLTPGHPNVIKFYESWHQDVRDVRDC